MEPDPRRQDETKSAEEAKEGFFAFLGYNKNSSVAMVFGWALLITSVFQDGGTAIALTVGGATMFLVAFFLARP